MKITSKLLSFPFTKSRAVLKTMIVAACVVAASGVTAQGQIIWGGPNTISDPSDISLSGTYVDAAGFFQGSTVNYVDVNGTSVAFNPLTGTVADPNTSHNTFTDGANITFSNITNDNGGDSYTGGSPGVTLQYSIVLSGVAYNAAGFPGTVTLSGLNSGDTYQVEVWQAHQDNSNVTNTTYTSVGGNSVTTTGAQFVLGTFVANSSDSQAFTFSGNVAEISTIEVRDLGVAAAPEPGTTFLTAVGLGGLVAFFGYRRRSLELRS